MFIKFLAIDDAKIAQKNETRSLFIIYFWYFFANFFYLRFSGKCYPPFRGRMCRRTLLYQRRDGKTSAAVVKNISDGGRKDVPRLQICVPDLPKRVILFGAAGHKIYHREA